MALEQVNAIADKTAKGSRERMTVVPSDLDAMRFYLFAAAKIAVLETLQALGEPVDGEASPT